MNYIIYIRCEDKKGFMTEVLIRELNELKESITCLKGYKCIVEMTHLPCSAKYHAQADLMECLEDQPDCGLFKAFSSTYVCTCPLRKKIALHFEEI
jgi:hypothetical protein